MHRFDGSVQIWDVAKSDESLQSVRVRITYNV